MLKAIPSDYHSLLCRRGMLIILILQSLLASSLSAEMLPGDLEKVQRAVAILNGYHAQNPEKGDRKVHVVSWRARDRAFPAKHQERLPRILAHIQKFYADENG